MNNLPRVVSQPGIEPATSWSQVRRPAAGVAVASRDRSLGLETPRVSVFAVLIVVLRPRVLVLDISVVIGRNARLVARSVYLRCNSRL